MISASNPHSFIGITKFGSVAIIETTGNQDLQVILRGGSNGPNYYEESIEKVVEQLKKTPFYPAVMVDCSHANSEKNYKRQVVVCENLCNQIEHGSYHINGVMIESHLVEGHQDLTSPDLDKLVYGQSITDACIGWETTEEVLEKLYNAIATRNTKFPRNHQETSEQE